MSHSSNQTIHGLATSPHIAAIRPQIDPARVIRDAITIQQIPAPTFAEDQRAAYMQERFTRYALADISTDAVYNVYGRWPGTDSARPALLASAHLDTVFPADTDLTIRHAGEQIYGPGLGDNSLGTAGLLALLDSFQEHDLHPAPDIWFVANSREEGLGDLGGIRAVWEKLGQRLGAAIVIEGMALGRVYHAGIAVRRLKITCHAPGGHSWLHFGNPSAIHGLIKLGARLLALSPPITPRTTYNIGLIEGGHSINSLATTAALYLDLRSENPTSLQVLEQQVRDLMMENQQSELTFTADVIGDRPSGQISTEHHLPQLAAAALRAIERPATFETGSTDANVLLANGLPTVTVGISHGGHAHRLDEFIETGPIADGIWQLLLLVLATAEQVHTWPR
ncbi:MAG: M20/M25/M40 family metallo-hydrolase [Anaerolineae bacterium]|nr:M20/M25/M40 family metallo-hydrolase [Anaerolineae bacterium]